MHRGRVVLIGLATTGLILTTAAQAETAQWVPTFPVEPGTSTAVDATPQGQAAVVVAGTSLVLSSNSGLTWLPAGSAPPNGGSSNTLVALASGQTLFTENGDAVARSTDGAASWKILTIPRVTKSKFFEYAEAVAAAHAGHAFAVGWNGSEVVQQQGGIPCPYPTKFAPVLTSHDDGDHWTVAKLPTVGDVEGVQWESTRDALAEVIEWKFGSTTVSGNTCGYSGEEVATSIWVTHDGGQRWKRSLRCPVPKQCPFVAWQSPTTAITADDSGTTYVSTDRGNTFHRGPQAFTQLLGGVGFIEGIGFAAPQSKRGWIDTNGYGIYRTDDAGKSWAAEPSAQDGLGYGVGSFAVIDALHAVAAGPKSVLVRTGTSSMQPPSSRRLPAIASPVAATVLLAPGVTMTIDQLGLKHLSVSLAS